MSSVICKQHPVDIEPIFCLRILEENYISANYNLRKNNTIALKVDFIEQDLFDTYLEEIIDLSLREDIGEGDHTSLSTIPDNAERKAVLLVKDNGIIAGIDLAKIIWELCETKKEFKVTHLPAFKHDVRKRIPDVSKAKEILGWEPKISFEKGLKEVVDWLRTELR